MFGQHIDGFVRDGQPAEVFENLISNLERHKHAIVDADKNKGVIIIRYLTLAMNAIVWRCWSDKVMVRIKAAGCGKTKVNVYAIPNLFRIKIKKREQVQNIGELLSQLREPFW